MYIIFNKIVLVLKSVHFLKNNRECGEKITTVIDLQ